MAANRRKISEKSDSTPNRSRFAKCDPDWLRLDLTGRHLRVLLALSLHADWTTTGFGRCFPRRDTIALETKLQVSHVSEAVRDLSEIHRVLTIVRLGRKNVYYVREIGSSAPMPPSDANPFFEYLGKIGIHVTLTKITPLEIAYMPESRTFDDFPLERRIFSDYVNGLVPAKIDAAVRINKATPTAGPLESALMAIPV